jgi:ABC-type nitrate/sulfonate/bicarbonate transport system permease component
VTMFSAAMSKLKRILPAAIVIAILIAVWWLMVVVTHSAIFPTPWQVVAGTLELARDGTLWGDIGASLMRVGLGFFLAVSIAVPLGLWMGWVKGAFSTLNPIFQILRPISPIAWIPIAIADLSHFHVVGVSDGRANHRRGAHHRAALPSSGREFWRLALHPV